MYIWNMTKLWKLRNIFQYEDLEFNALLENKPNDNVIKHNVNTDAASNKY